MKEEGMGLGEAGSGEPKKKNVRGEKNHWEGGVGGRLGLGSLKR